MLDKVEFIVPRGGEEDKTNKSWLHNAFNSRPCKFNHVSYISMVFISRDYVGETGKAIVEGKKDDQKKEAQAV